MEDRIRDLEKEVGYLRVDNATLGQSVELLSTNVKALTDVVQDLRDTMNKGRGALWAVCSGSAVAGGVVATVAELIFKK